MSDGDLAPKRRRVVAAGLGSDAAPASSVFTKGGRPRNVKPVVAQLGGAWTCGELGCPYYHQPAQPPLKAFTHTAALACHLASAHAIAMPPNGYRSPLGPLATPVASEEGMLTFSIEHMKMGPPESCYAGFLFCSKCVELSLSSTHASKKVELRMLMSVEQHQAHRQQQMGVMLAAQAKPMNPMAKCTGHTGTMTLLELHQRLTAEQRKLLPSEVHVWDVPTVRVLDASEGDSTTRPTAGRRLRKTSAREAYADNGVGATVAAQQLQHQQPPVGIGGGCAGGGGGGSLHQYQQPPFSGGGSGNQHQYPHPPVSGSGGGNLRQHQHPQPPVSGGGGGGGSLHQYPQPPVSGGGGGSLHQYPQPPVSGGGGGGGGSLHQHHQPPVSGGGGGYLHQHHQPPAGGGAGGGAGGSLLVPALPYQPTGMEALMSLTPLGGAPAGVGEDRVLGGAGPIAPPALALTPGTLAQQAGTQQEGQAMKAMNKYVMHGVPCAEGSQAPQWDEQQLPQSVRKAMLATYQSMCGVQFADNQEEVNCLLMPDFRRFFTDVVAGLLEPLPAVNVGDLDYESARTQAAAAEAAAVAMRSTLTNTVEPLVGEVEGLLAQLKRMQQELQQEASAHEAAGAFHHQRVRYEAHQRIAQRHGAGTAFLQFSSAASQILTRLGVWSEDLRKLDASVQTFMASLPPMVPYPGPQQRLNDVAHLTESSVGTRVAGLIQSLVQRAGDMRLPVQLGSTPSSSEDVTQPPSLSEVESGELKGGESSGAKEASQGPQGKGVTVGAFMVQETPLSQMG